MNFLEIETNECTMSTEEYTNVILQCINNLETDLNELWPRDSFQEHAYRIWAEEELLDRILDHPFGDPDLICTDLIIELETCRIAAVSDNAKRVFNIAIDEMCSLARYCRSME